MQEDFYRIIKSDSNLFAVDTPTGVIYCPARKKNKKSEILAGDFVKLDGGVIDEVMPRKNRLIRPAVANIDQILFVMCSVPKPDYFLLDKAIVNCLSFCIEPIICLNKSDINDQSLLKEVKLQYEGRTIVSASAHTGELGELKSLFCGKLTCLAGQSAVGKSSIVNALLGGEGLPAGAGETSGRAAKSIRIGELSAIDRGRNTTTSVELYNICGGLLADTPGFSLLDFQNTKSAELELYYPEFEELRGSCKYHKCTHVKEPGCAVSAAAASGTISDARYKRYIKLFEELKEKELKKFS